MSSSRLARSPLSIAEDCFRALCAHPHPLALDWEQLRAAVTAQPAPHPAGPTAEHSAEQSARYSVGQPVEMAGLVGFIDPDTGVRRAGMDEIRRWVRLRGTANQAKNAVWALVAARAHQQGAAWTIAAVGLALPHLVRMSAQLSGADGVTRHELDAEILTGFLGALQWLDPEVAFLWPRLQIAARRGGVTWLARQRGNRPGRVEADFDSAPPPPGCGHPDLVLAAAVRNGVISVGEAELIVETRLERIPTATVAARLGINTEALLKRRRRAELRLAAALRETLLDLDDAADPVAAQVLRERPIRTGPTSPDSGRSPHSYPQQDTCPRRASHGVSAARPTESTPVRPAARPGSQPVAPVPSPGSAQAAGHPRRKAA